VDAFSTGTWHEDFSCHFGLYLRNTRIKQLLGVVRLIYNGKWVATGGNAVTEVIYVVIVHAY